jgi:hypothetical protein
MACFNVQLRSTFTVEVRHDGHPLLGATVTVTGDSGTKGNFRGVTGPSGILTVSKLPPGNYSVDAEYLGLSATETAPTSSSCFKVARFGRKSAINRVVYEWHSTYATAIRAVSGQITESALGTDPNPVQRFLHKIEVPIRSARLTLRKVEADGSFDSVADADGTFQFPEVPPGLYVLQIDAQGQRTPRPSVHMLRILANAPPGELHVVADGAICGGSFLELKPTTSPQP